MAAEEESFLPQVAEGLDGVTVVAISAGDSHSAALTDDGRVFAVGCFRVRQPCFSALRCLMMHLLHRTRKAPLASALGSSNSPYLPSSTRPPHPPPSPHVARRLSRPAMRCHLKNTSHTPLDHSRRLLALRQARITWSFCLRTASSLHWAPLTRGSWAASPSA